jgi:hypothetical protein
VDPGPWFRLGEQRRGIFLTFPSEDSATLAGGLLATLGKLSWPLAFASCFLGIWLGDLGLYALARLFGRPAIDRFWPRRASGSLDRSEAWFERHGLLALVICRLTNSGHSAADLSCRGPAAHACGTLCVGYRVSCRGLGGIGFLDLAPVWRRGRKHSRVYFRNTAGSGRAGPRCHPKSLAIGPAEANQIPGHPALDAMGVLAGMALLFPDWP